MKINRKPFVDTFSVLREISKMRRNESSDSFQKSNRSRTQSQTLKKRKSSMTEAQRIIANQYIQIQRMKRLERKEKEFKEKQKKEIKKFRNIAHLNQEILAINTHRKYERNEYYRGKNKLNESISTIINEKELLVKINDANLIISGSIDEQCKTPKEEEKINISSINRATIQKSIKEITSRSKRNSESSLLDSNIRI